MKCPLCASEAGDADECPSCGAIFSKLREKKEREKKEAAEALAKLAAPPSALKLNPWTVRAAALAVVVMWMIGFAFYYKIHYSAGRKPRVDGPFAPPAPKSAAFVRDPATGKLIPVKIISAPSAQQRPSETWRAQQSVSPDSGAPQDAPPRDPDFDD